MSLWWSFLLMLTLFLLAIGVGTMCKYWRQSHFGTAVKLIFLLPVQTVWVLVLLYSKIIQENAPYERGRKKPVKRPLFFGLKWRLCVIRVLGASMPSISSTLAHEQVTRSTKIENIVRRTKNDFYNGLKAKDFCFG